MREDDQDILPDPNDGRRWWRSVFAPTFGRSAHDIEPLKESATPLFKLEDCDAGRLSSWLKEFDHWSRPTWIAVTTMYQRNTTAETRLTDIGVALESLGYSLLLKEVRVPSGNPPLLGLLKRICNRVGRFGEVLPNNKPVMTWCEDFNAAFMGAKHPNRELPEPSLAYELGSQGLGLMRLWLGVELGVSTDVLIKNYKQEAR
jgi:hypothetical protein